MHEMFCLPRLFRLCSNFIYFSVAEGGRILDAEKKRKVEQEANEAAAKYVQQQAGVLL